MVYITVPMGFLCLPLCKICQVSVQTVAEIFAVGSAAALFVPGTVAALDYRYLGVTIFFTDRSAKENTFLSQKPVVIYLYRVYLTVITKEIGLDVFISHDTPGN